MSLSTELDNPRSPIRQFIEFVGTVVADARRGPPWGDECKRLLGLDQLPREAKVAPPANSNSAIVGTAFDYRLRYDLNACRCDDFVAKQHGRAAARFAPDGAAQLSRFFDTLDDFASRIAPAGRHLAHADEELLCRYCIVLAWVETVFRAPLGRLTLEFPPARARSSPELEPLLTWAQPGPLADLVALSRSAERCFAPLVEVATAGIVPYHANPVFAGSVGIGGADADFVIGDSLFEVKTNKTLDAAAVRKALSQLLGYVLLDYDDRYSLRCVSVYFARHEWVTTWPLWVLLFPLAQVLDWTKSAVEPSEAEVAARLSSLRQLMQVVVNSGEIDYDEAFS